MPNWVNPDSASWGAFDAQVQRFGTPTAVWIQLCPYPTLATAEEVRTIIANTHEHAPGATVYITGIPFYEESPVCRLFVADAPAVVDALAQEAAADASNAVTYPGTFGPLPDEMVAGDACHPNAAGADFLGEQALGYWG
jgi:hypothetical protein